jgi:predicted transcriptional regulator
MSTATATAPVGDVTIKSVKELVGNIARLLPDDATWEDVQYHIGVCQSIQAGLADIAAGRFVSSAEARREFGLEVP